MTKWLVGDNTRCYGRTLLGPAADLRAVHGDGVGHRSAGEERHRRVGRERGRERGRENGRTDAVTAGRR